MNLELLKVRLVAFFWEALSAFILLVIAFLSSEEFAGIIVKHFGETVFTSLALMFVTGVVKHLRNLSVLKENNVGSDDFRADRDGFLL